MEFRGTHAPKGDTRVTAGGDVFHEHSTKTLAREQQVRAEDNEDEHVVDERVPYEDRTKDELKAELKRRDLPVSGKHADLVARLEEHDQSSGDEDNGDDGEDSEGGDSEDD